MFYAVSSKPSETDYQHNPCWWTGNGKSLFTKLIHYSWTTEPQSANEDSPS